MTGNLDIEYTHFQFALVKVDFELEVLCNNFCKVNDIILPRCVTHIILTKSVQIFLQVVSQTHHQDDGENENERFRPNQRGERVDSRKDSSENGQTQAGGGASFGLVARGGGHGGCQVLIKSKLKLRF